MKPRRKFITVASLVGASTLTVLAQRTDPVRPTPSGQPAAKDDDSIVQISEFRVNETKDQGYAAAYTMGGSRINTEIAKAPISVVVFNEDFRFDTAALDIQELVRFSAGVTGAANVGSGQISVRGKNLSGTTFRDGIQRNSNAGEAPDYMDMSLVERVEVIKGPAGTLFGAHNSGGMVNYVSKRPKEKRSTRFYALVQPDHDLYRLEVDDNRPLGQGWAYRANLAYQDGETTIGTRNDVRSGELAVAKKTRLADFLLRFSRTERDWLNTGAWFVDVNNKVSDFLPVTKSKSERDGVRDHNATSIDFETTFKISVADLTIGNRLVFRLSDSMMDTYNYSGADANHRFFTANNVLIGNALTASFADPRLSTIIVTRGVGLREFDQKVWALNYDSVVDFNTGPARHKLLFYGEAAGTERDAIVSTATYPTLDLMNPVYYYPDTASHRGPWVVSTDNHFETFGYAFAAQDQASFLEEKLILVAGARYDYAINDTRNNRTGLFTRSNDSRDGWTRKWAAVFRPRDSVSLYYNYSETFQPTSTNIGGVVLPNLEATNNEGGIKINLPGGKLAVTASYFDVETQNLVISVPTVVAATGAVITQALPVGRQSVRGWEADMTANLLGNRLSLLGGIGSLKSRTETGLRTRGVPGGLNYRLFARYNLPLARLKQTVWFAAGYERTGDRPVDNPDTYLLPTMELVDFVAGWQKGRLTLQANVSNVFDNIVPRAGTTRTDISPTDPRSLRLSARWGF